jgi:hypothetical protein
MNHSFNQTTDQRCADYACHALYCAEQLHLGTAGDNTLYGMSIRIPALADRIIALRTQQAAALAVQQ